MKPVTVTINAVPADTEGARRNKNDDVINNNGVDMRSAIFTEYLPWHRLDGGRVG